MVRIDVKVNTVEKFLSESIFHFFKGGCLSTEHPPTGYTKNYTQVKKLLAQYLLSPNFFTANRAHSNLNLKLKIL